MSIETDRTQDRLTGWARVGDIAFKLLLIAMFVFLVVSAIKNGMLVHQVFGNASYWVFALMFICLLGVILLLVGFCLRRNWARQLWIVGCILSLFHNLWFNYWAYPFSPKNDWPTIIGSIIGTGLAVWIFKSRWFSRYMCKPGRKRWFWIGLSFQILIMVACLGAAVTLYVRSGKNPVPELPMPTFSAENPMLEGWREAEHFGYIVPVIGTNSCTEYDDGSTSYAYKQLDGTNLAQLSWINDSEPVYMAGTSFLGVDSLEKHYQQSYVKRFSLWYAMERLIIWGDARHPTGFRSTDDFDVMVKCAETGPMFYTFVNIEDSRTGKGYEVILGSRTDWSVEDRLKLISRIRLAPEKPEEVYKYTVTNNQVTITKYSGRGGDVVIPDMLGGYPVTAIGDDAFSLLSSFNLAGITIPEGVTSIGERAFLGCFCLTSITMPESVTNIGSGAFGSCTALTDLTVPAGVTDIGTAMFGMCESLTNITISASVTNIGSIIFAGCDNLKAIKFLGDPPALNSNLFLDVPKGAVVYYTKESAGWGDTFGGLPARLVSE